MKHKFLPRKLNPDTEILVIGTFNPDIPSNSAACQALDVNLADLLEKKSKTEQVDWEKLCSFPIKFVKGVK